ncbi:MAG TPA: heavy-metal-associated domain-containing protein, partial [Noviherbaspirillum sp.]|nr:heavy-metal-associated domain-containing protein [Noviherbaspirillum sp.]
EKDMYQLTVEVMSCGHCIASVTKAVQTLDAGAKVDVELATQTVRVDTRAALDDVRRAVADAGFPVHQAQAQG